MTEDTNVYTDKEYISIMSNTIERNIVEFKDVIINRLASEIENDGNEPVIGSSVDTMLYYAKTFVISIY